MSKYNLISNIENDMNNKKKTKIKERKSAFSANNVIRKTIEIENEMKFQKKKKNTVFSY